MVNRNQILKKKKKVKICIEEGLFLPVVKAKNQNKIFE